MWGLGRVVYNCSLIKHSCFYLYSTPGKLHYPVEFSCGPTPYKSKRVEQTPPKPNYPINKTFSQVEEPREEVMEGTDEKEKVVALMRAQEKLQQLHSLAQKVKDARSNGHGIPDEILNEISMVVPRSAQDADESGEEENEEDEEEEGDEEKLSSLLRRKMELESVQNELKQLRHQQDLLNSMEEQGDTGVTRAMPEVDRETLWESLREKQVAQLDRLKRGESKYSE
eukprot:sb/3469638/